MTDAVVLSCATTCGGGGAAVGAAGATTDAAAFGCALETGSGLGTNREVVGMGVGRGLVLAQGAAEEEEVGGGEGSG